jgi:hypothetical protein
MSVTEQTNIIVKFLKVKKQLKKQLRRLMTPNFIDWMSQSEMEEIGFSHTNILFMKNAREILKTKLQYNKRLNTSQVEVTYKTKHDTINYVTTFFTAQLDSDFIDNLTTKKEG